ncbi:TetR family transcriptional regulator [Catellatospora methionotrophica]|uniref:acyl-CoA-like ligand-binding transcription factor n=1 Tax=Catellatospora methionotrophica TaxID=121620 RepID=UPI001EF17528|nr:TetR family transcriptional regulator [Catellatospora methionotrophica]
MTPIDQDAPLGRRDLRKQQTRAALTGAALRLCSLRGFDQVTVDDISGEAGVSSRTFFNYFASKEDAVLGDHLVEVDAMRARLAVLLPTMPVLEAIRRAVLLPVAAMEADRDHWFLRMEIIKHSPQLLPRLVLSNAEAERATTEQIAAHLGVDPATHVYPALVVATTSAAFRVAATGWMAAAGARSLGALVDRAFTALAAGLPDPD